MIHFNFSKKINKKISIVFIGSKNNSFPGKIGENNNFIDIHTINREKDILLLIHRIKDKSIQKPDMILLDLSAPDINGLLVLKTLRFDKANDPIIVIAVANKLNLDEINMLFEHQVNGYIHKSRSTEEFHDAILEEIYAHAQKIGIFTQRHS